MIHFVATVGELTASRLLGASETISHLGRYYLKRPRVESKPCFFKCGMTRVINRATTLNRSTSTDGIDWVVTPLVGLRHLREDYGC